ncbi:BatD family protein, partial [bacterium]|nr:BatD family protein [bacterium]
PWLMQPVVVECTLFLDQYENLIRGVDWEAPKWQAFFAEEAEVQRSFRPVEIGGRRYQALTIKRFLLSPTGAGRIEIPASQAVCGIRVQRRSSFENRFFGPGFNSLLDDQIPIRLPIAARTIDVRPLPVEGRPASFQNAVGQFSFAASVDRKQMTTDDILTLCLEVAGEGFLGSLDDPEFPKWKDWREAGKQAETTPGSSSFSGKKTFEILLRPEKSGALTIPEIRYAWFDPEQERYVEEMGGPFAVEVTPGKEHELIVVGPAGQGRDAASPRFFGEQIAYIHPVLPSATSWTPLYERPWFWPLQTIPLLIILCGLAMRFWRLYIEDHQDERRWRSAGSRARKELREAGASLHRGHTEEFYSVLGQALRDYIAVKLDRSASGLTLEEIAQTCRNRDVPEEKTATFIRLLEECDQARYLSVKPDPARAREALGEAARWLKELDRHL